MAHHTTHVLHGLLLLVLLVLLMLELLLLLLLLLHSLSMRLPLTLNVGMPHRVGSGKRLALVCLARFGWDVVGAAKLDSCIVQHLAKQLLSYPLDLRIDLLLRPLLLLLLLHLLLLLLLLLQLLHLLHCKGIHVGVLAVHHLIADLSLHSIRSHRVHPSHLLLHLSHLWRDLTHAVAALHVLQSLCILLDDMW